MNIGPWDWTLVIVIQLVLAIITLLAVFVALGIGVSSIVQTKRLKQKEQRQRLLKEIIEWAIDFTKSRFGAVVRDLLGITDRKKQDLFIFSHIVEIKETFLGMSGRNRYIENVVLKFEQGLQKATAELIDDLEAYIVFLDEWQGAGADAINDEKSVEKADKHELQLKESANKVIEEAAKIKTKDIG